jgi:hypothetical protein
MSIFESLTGSPDLVLDFVPKGLVAHSACIDDR